MVGLSIYKTASVCEFKEQQRLVLEYHCSHTLVLVNSESGLSDCWLLVPNKIDPAESHDCCAHMSWKLHCTCEWVYSCLAINAWCDK